MKLSQTIETLQLLGDESRLRLCALLGARELCVSDLVRVTGLSQSRVSTHLGRLREAGFVRDRPQGAQCYYGLATADMPDAARALLEEVRGSQDPTLVGDQKRLVELDAERRGDLPDSALDDLERYYSPGRSWQSLAAGIAAMLRLGDVLDVGTGDGSAAQALAPYCHSLTCVDISARMVEMAQRRLTSFEHVRTQVADVHELPFSAASYDVVLLFHTLTYAQRPGLALKECARVLRPGGRLVLLCLDAHEQSDVSARYGERHPGFSPKTLRRLVSGAGLDVAACHVASRESKKPHLQVVLAAADKPKPPARGGSRVKTN